ncbi:MAG: hypothetical protein A2Z97_06260 [Bdellovibrionales bacterium GWB1_52_6]|nr:MAG: hypothetical protein A2Z97_06260 [Bdellovibrionales bacterium GWB1_52_6]
MANLTSRTMRQMTNKTTDMIDDATDMAEEYIDDARDWLEDNYGKALGGLALVTVAGFLGYFFFKNRNERD